MFANVFCYFCNVFYSCFHANKTKTNNNKASFMTFERCSRSKSYFRTNQIPWKYRLSKWFGDDFEVFFRPFGRSQGQKIRVNLQDQPWSILKHPSEVVLDPYFMPKTTPEKRENRKIWRFLAFFEVFWKNRHQKWPSFETIDQFKKTAGHKLSNERCYVFVAQKL